MNKLAVIAAAFLISPMVHAAQSESARNKLAYTAVNAVLAKENCGYVVNSPLLMMLMHDAGVTLDDLIFTDYARQAMNDARAEIAAGKHAWCEEVWKAFGSEGKIEQSAVLDLTGHKPKPPVTPAPAVFGKGKLKICWPEGRTAEKIDLHLPRGLVFKDEKEDEVEAVSPNFTLVIDQESTLKKSDKCVMVRARLIDPGRGQVSFFYHNPQPVEHSITPEQERSLMPAGILTEDGSNVTFAESPRELDHVLDAKVATPFGETKPTHATNKTGAKAKREGR